MENFKAFSCLSVVFASVLIFLVTSVNGQISTPCTSSMVTSFTPCLNFVTGSTGGGGSSTKACCDLLRSLTSSGMDCACLIITGNVPFSLPINQTLAISLPRACKSSSVPIQCKASGVPLPAPGPVLFGPSPPPTTATAPFSFSPSSSPRASKALAFAPASPPAETTTDITPASPPAETTSDVAPTTPNSPGAPTASPRIRPVLNPISASNPSYNIASPFLLLGFLGIMFLNNN